MWNKSRRVAPLDDFPLIISGEGFSIFSLQVLSSLTRNHRGRLALLINEKPAGFFARPHCHSGFFTLRQGKQQPRSTLTMANINDALAYSIPISGVGIRCPGHARNPVLAAHRLR
jgi:hypothetical protein